MLVDLIRANAKRRSPSPSSLSTAIVAVVVWFTRNRAKPAPE